MGMCMGTWGRMGTDRHEMDVVTWGASDGDVCGDMGTDGHEMDVVTWEYGDVRGGDGCGDMGTNGREVDMGDIRDGEV